MSPAAYLRILARVQTLRFQPLTSPQKPEIADKLNTVCKVETVGMPKTADSDPDPDRLEATGRKRPHGDVRILSTHQTIKSSMLEPVFCPPINNRRLNRFLDE